MQNIVIVGMNHYQHAAIHDSVRALAAAWLRLNYRCLYINPPLGWHYARSHPSYFLTSWRWQRQTYDGLVVLTPPLGFLPTALGLRRRIQPVLAKHLQFFLNKTWGPHWQENTLFYVSSWSYTLGDFLRILAPRNLFFHLLDDNLSFPHIAGCPRTRQENERFLSSMFHISKVVAAVSEELARRYQPHCPRPIHIVRNGVDPERFLTPAPEPEALKPIPRPRLLYLGSINSWVDLDLLTGLARNRPHYHLILVGPVFTHTIDQAQWETLISLPNVYYTGSCPYQQVPAYLQAADVLLLPRTFAAHSLASDPLKLYEYLATGKPVVTTSLPAVTAFREVVFSGDSTTSFNHAVDRALFDASNPQRRTQQLNLVAAHSWTNRAQEIIALVGKNRGGEKFEPFDQKQISPCQQLDGRTFNR